jgi:hypothetical protein
VRCDSQVNPTSTSWRSNYGWQIVAPASSAVYSVFGHVHMKSHAGSDWSERVRESIARSSLRREEST